MHKKDIQLIPHGKRSAGLDALWNCNHQLLICRRVLNLQLLARIYTRWNLHVKDRVRDGRSCRHRTIGMVGLLILLRCAIRSWSTPMHLLLAIRLRRCRVILRL
jgi:hypothetical protein